jgi:hypothetical protein
VRQGEWFFLPEPDVQLAEWLILRHEPLTRGAGSKPHVCDEMVRTGGEIVWVHPVYAPRGTTPERYGKLAGYQRAQTNWQQMRRNAAVFVRGRVRHADHKTIRLPGWHRVLMNTESEAPAAHRVVFLD